MAHDSDSHKHAGHDALIPSEGSEYFGKPVVYHTEESDTEGPMHPKPPCPDKCELGPVLGQPRRTNARDIRIQAANDEYAVGFLSHVCNGDEHDFKDRNYIASFTKALPHDCRTGEVDPEAYCALLRALDSADPSDFELIPLGCSHPGDDPCRPSLQRKLENPQAGYSYDMEGADSHALWMPPPPKFSSADEMAEISEIYWMALARDVPFNDYPGAAGNGILNAAFTDLSGFAYYTTLSPFFTPPLTRDTLFRGTTQGDRRGPYVSQFLLVDTPYGAQTIPARIRTVQPGVDYMTGYFDWLDAQNGCDANQSACDPMPRLIRSGRDLAQLVHVDADFNAHYNACFILGSGRDPLRRCEASAGFGIAFEKHLPYVNPATPPVEEFHQKSRTQIGVGTFGIQHVKSLLLEVVTRAAKAVWFQKWQVHRRLRPEEFGGRIHRQRIEPAVANYPIHSSLLISPLFKETGDFSIFRHNSHQNCNKRCRRHCAPHETEPHPLDTRGTYLLPMAYAEGSPIHPSYGAGHATIAGACVTILKAFFADGCIVNPVIANRNGTALEPYTGDDRNELTIHGELNKLASNISLARNIAGVHWRSDHAQSLLLGEKVAISLLFDQRDTYNEDYQFTFKRFDDVTNVVIDKSTTLAQLAGWLP